ncbi:carbohydrate ABC transporter permease [Thermodesulfobacterium hydrogeniphilum]|uniref:carbohydrate ABC transporter permease n=1 Tax=Thermodesulfobacterium hydrogeniphilum TaxID=161156 RepID=UPI00056E3D36|nr:carbohydrate ABC transporter permease [Thermodesulfobacterium hydrogeniphilum]
MREEKFVKFLFVITAVSILSFCLMPFFYMLVISFSTSWDITSLDKIRFSFSNYIEILKDPSLHCLDYIKNSLIISAVSSFISVFIASLGAYAISRLDFPFKFFLLLFILASSMFPQITIVGYLFKFMNKLHLINTYLALIFPYIAWTLPLSLWIMVSYFSKIPKELDKAALIDGCNWFQIFIKIILPLSKPGFISAGLLSFLFAFNEFLFALMLTIDYHARTVPVGVALFQGLHGELPWGSIMAFSILSLIPVILITLIFQRYIIQGLTRGGLKE